MAKAIRGQYEAVCNKCELRWAGSEVYVRRKASIHAKQRNHHVSVGRQE